MDLALLVKVFIFGVVMVVTVTSVVIPLLSAAATEKGFRDYPAGIAALMKPEALRYDGKGKALSVTIPESLYRQTVSWLLRELSRLA